MQPSSRSICGSIALLAVTAVGGGCGTPSDESGGDPCQPVDADGIVGGTAAFELTVDDHAFAPKIIKAQNRASVTLKLKNVGSRPHDFVVDCIPTPNEDGCAQTSCFPAAAAISPVEPGSTSSTTFVVPVPEGIYDFRSDVSGDTQAGQFVVQ